MGRRLEGHLSSPHKFQHGSAGAGAAGLGGAAACQPESALLETDRVRQGATCPGLPWFLLLGLLWSGSYHSLQGFLLSPELKGLNWSGSAGLIPCGQVMERSMLGSFTMSSSLSPVSSICSLILCPHAHGARLFHEHVFPAPRLPSALEQRSQGDKPSGQSQQGVWRGESQTGETVD